MSDIYSVSRLNQEIKMLLENYPPFRTIYVQGEISNFKLHSSGHLYLTLKDDGAAINAVMFRSDAQRLRFRPENGMKVIAGGRISAYPKSGQVQLYIADLVPDGIGALSVAFEQLKRKLQAEGLFDETNKKPIPAIPQAIALITSPTGAAVRDMIRILRRRWPLAEITLYPALVQGAGAAASISHALALANAVGEADVILCGRGGGSMEDLWAFNEEEVARAIFQSDIPVISAVGHEPDVTIADFVADLRAPTPSGAAELAVPDRLDYQETVRQLSARLRAAARQCPALQRSRLNALSERLEMHTPIKYVAEKRLLLDQTSERIIAALFRQLRFQRQTQQHLSAQLPAAYTSSVQKKRMQFSRLVAALDAMSPLKVLERGYAVACKDEKAVLDVAELKKNDILSLRFYKGEAECSITKILKGAK